MKHHAQSCQSVEHLRKPFHIHHRLRRKARHAPPDGRAVEPKPTLDFAAIIAEAPGQLIRRHYDSIVQMGGAFAAVGM